MLLKVLSLCSKKLKYANQLVLMIYLDSEYHLVNQYYWNPTPLKFSKSFVNGPWMATAWMANCDGKHRRISTTDLLTCGQFEISPKMVVINECFVWVFTCDQWMIKNWHMYEYFIRFVWWSWNVANELKRMGENLLRWAKKGSVYWLRSLASLQLALESTISYRPLNIWYTFW